MIMKKSSIILIFISVFISLLVSIFAVGHIAAWLSQIPVFSKYAFVNPQAPIVVTKREFIRADDGSDTIAAINDIKKNNIYFYFISSRRVASVGLPTHFFTSLPSLST